MATNMATYIANLGKSVAYATVDKFGKMSPSTSDLVQTNSALFKEITHSLIDYRNTFKKSKTLFKNSKIYDAADTGIHSIFEDIQTGKLWNKDRIDKITEKNLGFGEDGGFGSSDGFNDIDFGNDSNDDFGSFDSDPSGDVTAGDSMITGVIAETSEQNARMISSTIARTSKYIVDSQQTSANIAYAQNVHSNNIFNTNLSSINSNISKVLGFQSTVVQTHAENSKKYFEHTTKLMEEQTALLKQLVDATVPKKTEDKKSSKIGYGDMVTNTGVPDVKMYMQNVKKNFGNAFGSLTSMNSLMGEDSNMLQLAAASPLQFIPTYIINKVIPEALNKSIENFDKSLKGFFGSMIAKINGMKSSDNMILSKIGEIFGVNNSAKTSIDTKNYNKGKVDWDGKSRKALIEVIPGYLSKIVAALSGSSERIYDYDNGKFVDATAVKDSFEKDKKNYVKTASSDVMSKIDDYMKYLTFNTVAEQKKMNEDVNKILTAVYNKGGFFDVNSKKEDDHIDYGVDEKSLAIFKTMFKNMDGGTQLGLGADIVETRDKQTKEMQSKENSSDDIIQSLFNGFNGGEFIAKNSKSNSNKESTGGLLGNSLLKTVDGRGNNIFYYLQNMWKELVYIKRNGGGGSNGNSTPPTIEYGNSRYTPAGYAFDIPDNRKVKPESQRRIDDEREQTRFENDKERRLAKDSKIINASEGDDNLKSITSKLGSRIETEKIKDELNKNRERPKSMIDKLLEAESITDKTKTVVEKINEITKKPMKFVINTIDKVDKRMYDLIFGKNKYKGKDVAGIFGIIKLELTNQFSKINTFIDEKILHPIKNKLGVDSFKDLSKKVFGMFGIDPDDIKKKIKDYLFDKDSGLFSSIIKSTKDIFSRAFEMSKDSLKSVYGPLFKKIKDATSTKSSTNMRQSLDDLDNDEESDDISNSPISNTAATVINNALRSRRQADMEEAYNGSLKNVKKEDRKHTLQARLNAMDIANPDSMRAEIEEERARLAEHLNAVTTPGITLVPGQMESYEQREKEFKKKELDLSAYYSYNKMIESMNNREGKDDFNNSIQDRKTELTSGISKLSDMDETETTLLEKIFGKLVYTSTYDSLNFGKVLELSKDLATRDRKYKSVYNKLLEYSSMFSDASRLSVDNIITNNRRNVKEQSKSASDFEGIASAFANGGLDQRQSSTFDLKLQEYVSTIKDKVIGIFDILKELTRSNSGQSQNVGPLRSTALNPALTSTPEGQATLNFAEEATNTFANWMYGRIPHHAEGGTITSPEVATLNKGEVVLTEDKVKSLLDILTDIEEGTTSGKTARHIGSKADSKVQSLVNSSNIRDTDDFSKFMDFATEDPRLLKKLQKIQSGELYDKIFNIFNINLNKALETYNAKIAVKDADGIPTDPIQRAMYNESQPFAKKVVDELYSGTTTMHDALFGTNKNRDKKKFGEAVSDVTRNITKYAPEAIGAGLLGGGVSLITGAIGGPLLGAAAGAGISLAKNSEKVQNWLFGDMDQETNERKGGVISKKLVNKIAKLAPDLTKYGIAGGLTGLLPMLPFGPVGGLLIGSSIAFAKNNEKLMDFMFGENGVFKKKDVDKVKKFLPKMAIGAGIGLLTGPFGFMGNAIVGAAGGILSSSDTLNTTLFGVKDPKTGEYEDGIMPAFRHTLIDPLKSFMTTTNTRIQDFIGDHILSPLKDAFKPFKKDLSLLAKGMFNKIGDFINNSYEKRFGIPLSKALEDVILKPLRFIGRGVAKAAAFGGKVLTSPFAAIGALGRKRQRAHIRKGNADYLNVDQRNEFRQNNKMGSVFKDEFANFDEMLGNMSDSDKSGLYSTLNVLKSSKSDLIKQKSDITSNMGSEISKYLSYGQSKESMKNINRDVDGALDTSNMDLVKKFIDSKNSKNLKTTDKRSALVKELSKAHSDKTMSPSERSKLLRTKQKDLYDLFGSKYGGDHETAKKAEKLIKAGKFDEISALVTGLRDKDNTKAFDLMNLINQNNDKLQKTNMKIADSDTATSEFQEQLRGMKGFENLDLTNKRDIEKYMNLINKEIGVKGKDLDPNVTPEQIASVELDQKYHKSVISSFDDVLELLKIIANSDSEENVSDSDRSMSEKSRRKSAKDAYKATFGKSVKGSTRADTIDNSISTMINKRQEEIENSNLPKEVKEQALKDLVRVRHLKPSEDTIRKIKQLQTPEQYLSNFKKNIRDTRGITEESLREQDRFKPYYEAEDRAKDENQVAENEGVDPSSIESHAKGGFINRTQISSLSRGEYVNTPNNVASIMESVPTLLNTLNTNEEGNSSVFKKMLAKLTALVDFNKNSNNTVEKIDNYGNVMKFYRNSRNDLVPDKGDSGTVESIASANRDKENNVSMFSKLGSTLKGALANINPFNKDKEKKGSFLDGILDTLKKGAMVAAGIVFLPTIIKAVAPVAKKLWDESIHPWLEGTVLPWFKDTALPFIGNALGEAVKFAFGTILPGLGKGLSKAFGLSGENGEESATTHLGTAVARDAITGSRGAAALGRFATNRTPGSLTGKGVKLITRAGAKVTEVAGKVVTSPLRLIDRATGLTKIGGNLGYKAAEPVLNAGIKASEAVTKAASGQSTGIIGKLCKKVFEFMDKIGGSTFIKKILGNKKFEGRVIAQALVKFLEKNSLKLAAKVSAKVAAAATSAGIINAVWAVADFTSGFNNADNIMGVTQSSTLGMKLAAGTIKAINGLLLFGLIPESILVDIFLPVFAALFDSGKDIQAMRDSAKTEVTTYNAENGTDYSVEQYNKTVLGKKSLFGKIADANTWVGEKDKQIRDWGWDKAKQAGSKLVEANNWLGEKDKQIRDWGWDKAKEGANYIKDGTINGAKFINDSATKFWNDSKIKIADKYMNLSKNIDSAADTANKKLGSIFGMVDDEGNALSMTEGITKQWSKFTGNIGETWGNMKETALDTFTNIKDTIKDKFGKLKDNFISALDVVNKKLGAMLGLTDKDGNSIGVSDYAKDTVDNIGSKLKTTWGNIKEGAGSIISNIKAGAASIFGNGLTQEGGFGPAPKANTKIMKDGGFGSDDINGMTYYSQSDSHWAQNEYGTGTIGSSGCGPTSAAMVIDSLTGNGMNPVSAAEYAVNNGYRVPNVGTSWDYFKSIGDEYHVNFDQTTDRNSIMSALANQQPVIFSGKGGAPFTKGGHFVVGAGTDGTNISINDPVSKARSIAYPSSQIFNSMATAFIANKKLSTTGTSKNASATAGTGIGVLGSASSLLAGTKGLTSTGEAAATEAPSIFNMVSDFGNLMSSSFNRLFGFADASSDSSSSASSIPTADYSGLVSKNIIEFIKSKEGFSATPYDDGAGTMTIGYGSTHGDIMNKSNVSEVEATQALIDEVNSTASEVKANLDAKGVKLAQNEFDALVSFAYNVGTGALFGSTLYRKIVEGARGKTLTSDFMAWDKAGGQVMQGLMDRRSDESNIFSIGSAPGYNTPAEIGGAGFGDMLKYRSTNMEEGGFGIGDKIKSLTNRKSPKVPSRIENSRSGGFGNMLNYQPENVPTYKTPATNDSITIGLIKSIINVLIKISSNTDNLQNIVELLADVLKVKIPEESIKKASTSSGSKQLTNMLSNSTNVDNSSLLKILNALATE